MAEPTPLLTEDQRRRLSVRLGLLVSEARDMLETLARAPADAAPESALSSARAALRDLISDVEETCRTLVVPLHDRSPDLLRRLENWSAVWWARVLDLRPESLTGSGPVSGELTEILAPAVQRIADRLAGIQRGVEAASLAAERPPPDP